MRACLSLTDMMTQPSIFTVATNNYSLRLDMPINARLMKWVAHVANRALNVV